MAKKYSEDPGSAQNGGLLPPLTKGRTVPEFEQAAFNTPKGQTTGIIRTSYGFHIIRVEDKQTARVKPLDEVKAQIEPAIKQQKAAPPRRASPIPCRPWRVREAWTKLRLTKGLTVTNTDLLAQSDPLPAVGTAQELSNDLFSTKKDHPPATAQIPQGFAIYQVTEIQPPQTPTFDQIKAQVEEQFRAQRAQALLAQKTQELSDRAHAGPRSEDSRQRGWRNGEDQRPGQCHGASSRLGAMSGAGQRGLCSWRRRDQRSVAGRREQRRRPSCAAEAGTVAR